MTDQHMTNLRQFNLKDPRLAAAARQCGRALLAILVLALTVTACSNRKPGPITPNNPAQTPVEKRGDWFCQPAPADAVEPWQCIQDKALAKNPKPDRLPNAREDAPQNSGLLIREPSKLPMDIDEPVPDPGVEKTDSPGPDAPPPPPPDLSAQAGSDPPPLTSAKPTSNQNAQQSTNRSRPAKPLPDYIRLAYQPPEPVSIFELPSHFYAVQLAALTSAKDMDAFVEEHQLNSLTAAKVIVAGKVRYVLILGIYDSREKAELAAAGQKPAPLARFTPWIRKLSNLQKAMQAAAQKDQI